MARTRLSDEQLLALLEQHDHGASVKELAERHGVSESTIRRWIARSRSLTRQPDPTALQEAATVALPPIAASAVDADLLGIRGGPVGWLLLFTVCCLLVSPLLLPVLDPDAMQLQSERVQQFAQSQGASSVEALDFNALDGQRLEGAWLSRDSQVPYWLAAALGSGLLILLKVLFPRTSAIGMSVAGLFTAIAGIALLLGFQYIASLQIPTERAPGYMVPLIWLVNLIGRSYGQLHSVMSGTPVGFFELFSIFFLTAGLCEESCKALPYVSGIGDGRLSADTLFTLGCASGLGFGLAEAIHYSMSQYNGLMTEQIYLIRFGSVVVLHGVWAASAALTFHRLQDDSWTSGVTGVYAWCLRLLRVVWVPALLHALYDAFSLAEMAEASFAAAFASVAYLAWRVLAADHR